MLPAPPRPAGSNEGFWAAEWSKHGTCALTLLPNQTAYFGTALALNEELDINVRQLAAPPASLPPPLLLLLPLLLLPLRLLRLRLLLLPGAPGSQPAS